MANPLPLILAAGAAIVLLGGKKKPPPAPTEKPEPAPTERPEPPPSPELPSPEPDEPPNLNSTASTGAPTGYGTTSSGLRRDRLGSHAWRITFDESGYHAKILVTATRFSPVQEELGTAATENGARKILSDTFNQRLLARYPNEKAKSDPHQIATIMLSTRLT